MSIFDKLSGATKGFDAKNSGLFQQITKSAKDTREDRALAAVERIERSLSSFIITKRDELSVLLDKQVELLDIRQDSTLSTRILPKEFDPQKFGKEALGLQLEIELLEQEIEVYERMYSKIIGETNYVSNREERIQEVVVKVLSNILPKELIESESFEGYIKSLVNEK